MPEPTYYTLLGVSATASCQEIKQAYRRLARASHPDLHPGNPAAAARFTEVAAAAAVLTDPDHRAAYDTQLATYPARATLSRDMRRDGYDVAYAVTVSRAEAAHGTQRALEFHAPDGVPYQILVVVPAGSRAGTRIRLAGQGGPAFSGPNRGDLYVTILIAEERGA